MGENRCVLPDVRAAKLIIRFLETDLQGNGALTVSWLAETFTSGVVGAGRVEVWMGTPDAGKWAKCCPA
jgi:hypothetical protein